MSPGGFRGYPQIASHVVGRLSVDQLEQDATFALGQTEGDVDVGIANAELASAAMERKTEAPRTIARGDLSSSKENVSVAVRSGEAQSSHDSRRSAEPRVGTACVSTVISRWLPYNQKKKKKF